MRRNAVLNQVVRQGVLWWWLW